MCRLMAYVAESETTLPEFVGSDFSEFLELSRIHKDGWGLAYVEDGTAKVAKKALAAADDDYFSETLSQRKTKGGLLHFRWATPGLAIDEKNSHPFVYNDISLIHNGSITPYDSLLPLISSQFLALRQGTTDSELYFLFLLTKIDELGLEAGVKSTIETLRRSFSYTSINSMIMTPNQLFVLSEHDPDKKPDWADEFYYELRYRINKEGIAVASSGWNQDGWELLPNHSLLIFDRRNFTLTVNSL